MCAVDDDGLVLKTTDKGSRIVCSRANNRKISLQSYIQQTFPPYCRVYEGVYMQKKNSLSN